MLKINISSQMCEYTHTISGKIKWEKIIVEINTPFEKFKASPCPKPPSLEISGTLDRSIHKISRDIEPNCSRKYLIPDMSRDICSIEQELAVAML